MLKLNKVSKQKSTMFLYALKGALSMGIPLTQAVKMLSKTQPKPLDSILKKIIFLVENKNQKIEDLLEKFGIINYNEKLLLEKANDTKFAVNEIIKMRQIENKFTGTLIKLFRFPIIILVTMPFLSQYLVGVFSVPLNQLKLILKSMGITYHSTVPHAFFYVYHPDLLPYVGIGSGILAVLMFVLYLYFRQNKPEVLYKILKPVAYDDLPFIISYMSALSKVGYPAEKISDILAKSSLKPGWKSFFKNLNMRIKNGDKIYTEFRKFGFPPEIVNYIEYSERSGNLWKSLDDLKEISIERNKEINNFFLSTLSPVFTYVSYIIVIYYIIGAIYLNLEIYNISNTLAIAK